MLEKNATVGGRVGTWECDGFRFDTGPSWYLMPEVFDHFFRLLGTTAAEQLDLVQLDPGYRVYGEGFAEPLDISADVDDNIALFERVERGAGKRLREYLDRAAELYALAKEHFLYTTFARLGPVFGGGVLGKGGRLGRLLVEPLGSLTRRTVRDRRLRQILGYPAVFLGSAPDLAPSLYSLMSHLDLADGVRYPLGGFRTIIDRIETLARAEGVEIRTGAEVVRITVDAGHASGVELVGGGAIVADVVVSAADLHHTETGAARRGASHASRGGLAWPQSGAERAADPARRSRRAAPAGAPHPLLLGGLDRELRRDLPGADPHPRRPVPLRPASPPAPTRRSRPTGRRTCSCSCRCPPIPGLGQGGVGGDGAAMMEALADRVIAQIGDWGGIPDLAERIVVRRTIGPADFASDFHAWKGGALGLAHTLRQSAFFRPGDRSRKVRGLYYAGASTIPGVGLPMCLISAELIVKRLRGDTSAGPLPEPLR